MIVPLSRRIPAILPPVVLLLAVSLEVAEGPPALAQAKKPLPKASVNPNVTKDNYDKVQLGMSHKDVVAILGKEGGSRSTGDKATRFWYKTSSLDPEKIQIDFVGDMVTAKHSTVNWPTATGAVRGLNKENYLRVKPAMAKEDVIDLFGPPTGKATTTKLDWEQDGVKVSIMLNPKGRVQSKSNNKGWPNDEAGAVAEFAKVWKEKIDQVKPGASEEDVAALLGPATKTERASAGRSALLWEDHEKFTLVVFQDKKAVRVDSSVLPADTKDICRANFERVKPGMSRAAAVAVLGDPTEDKDSTLIWRQDGKFLSLRFGKDDKIAERHSSAKDEPYIVFEKTETDRIDDALAKLRTFDSKKRKSALDFFAQTPFNEDAAPEVSRLAQNALQDKDTFTRHAAERVLRQWATKENADYFLRILSAPVSNKVDDPNRDKLPLAIDVLVKLRDPRAAAPLCKLLNNFFDRDTAVKGLEALGGELAGAEVAKHINNKDFAVRKACEDLLKSYKTGDNILLTRCLEDIKSPDPERRGNAIGRMSTMPVDAKRKADVAKVLEEHLADKSFYTATMAASMLGKWGTSANEPALLAVLTKTPSRDMKTIVCKSLQQVGTKQSLPALQPLTRDFELSLAGAAREAIEAIQKRGKG